jgi:hypothetical protein
VPRLELLAEIKRRVPHRGLPIRTNLSPQQVAERVGAEVEPRRWIRLWAGGSKAFEGRVDEHGFEMSRIIGYRNSFVPILRGRIEPRDGGCAVHVTMDLHLFVKAFGAVWFSGVLLGAIACTVATIVNGNPLGLLAWVLPLFGFLLFTVPFGMEADTAEALLRAMLPDADIGTDYRHSPREIDATP